MTEKAELFGRITKVLKYGKDNDPAIFVVHTQGLNRDFTVTCAFFCPIQENDSIYAVCSFDQHPRYGLTLQVERPPFVQLSMDKDSVLRCFIRILRGTGFGNIKAHQLFDLFSKQGNGDNNVINTISELAGQWLKSQDEDLFIPYSGILNKEQMKKLLYWWHKNRSLRRLYLFGLTNREIEACRLPADIIYERCLSNPYTLPPISMEKCEEILNRQNKVGHPDDIRCGQIIRKIYSMLEDRAWTGTPSNMMISMFEDMPKHLTKLKTEYGVRADLHTVYLGHPYEVETVTANKVQLWVEGNVVTGDTPFETKNRETAHFTNKTLTDEQKAAIQGALDYNISIITGSAGTGKTTIIGEIINNLELRDIRYCVASFTGKAVSRIREVIKRRSPSTLHRLIARSLSIAKFGALIIDEASMVTTELLYDFLRSFSYFYKIILVGDINQLQPIGWGTMFEQLIKSGTVPIFRLSQNHRLEKIDGDENGIMINANNLVELSNGGDPDEPFDFVQTDNFQMLEGNIETVYDIIRLLYQGGINAKEVTVLTPYNKELAELNQTMQQIFNETSQSVIDKNGKLWCVKDRVMLIENNYNINIFNGEEGMVVDVSPQEIGVIFADGATHYFKMGKEDNAEGKKDDEHEYREKDLTIEMLTHCFAYSIHKSQGSEWPYVIIYIPNSSTNSNFLSRNLIYTALTRAKRAVWVVGQIETFRTAAYRTPPFRCENLALRLKNALPQKADDHQILQLYQDNAPETQVEDFQI
jgi:hypothetical protein